MLVQSLEFQMITIARRIIHPSFVKIMSVVSEILHVTNVQMDGDRAIVPLQFHRGGQ